MSKAKRRNDRRLTFYFVQLFRKLRSFSRCKGSWCALLKTELYIPWEITASSWGMHSLNLHVPPVTRYSSLLWSLLVLYWQIICEISAVLKWTEPRAFTSNVSEGIGWLTATVMPLTKANTVSMYDICAYDIWDLDRRKWWTHNLTHSSSQCAFKVGVRVNAEFTGDACCREVVGTLYGDQEGNLCRSTHDYYQH